MADRFLIGFGLGIVNMSVPLVGYDAWWLICTAFGGFIALVGILGKDTEDIKKEAMGENA